jgi:hypothetical protein
MLPRYLIDVASAVVLSKPARSRDIQGVRDIHTSGRYPQLSNEPGLEVDFDHSRPSS